MLCSVLTNYKIKLPLFVKLYVISLRVSAFQHFYQVMRRTDVTNLEQSTRKPFSCVMLTCFMHSYATRKSLVLPCVAFAANSSELISLLMDVVLPVLRENKWLVRMKVIHIRQLIIRRGRGGLGLDALGISSRSAYVVHLCSAALPQTLKIPDNTALPLPPRRFSESEAELFLRIEHPGLVGIIREGLA